MDRRKFLSQLVGGVAVAAAARTWPFRVYSFPLEICFEGDFVVTTGMTLKVLRTMKEQLVTVDYSLTTDRYYLL